MPKLFQAALALALTFLVAMPQGDVRAQKAAHPPTPEEAQNAYTRAKAAYEAEDYKSAVGLFFKACNGDVMEACFQTGVMFSRAQGVLPHQSNKANAQNAFGKACAKGILKACHRLSSLYFQGSGEASGKAYMENCKRSYGPSCTKLAGSIFYDKTAPPEAKKVAINIYARGCQLREPEACGTLGRIYQLGKVHPKDDAKARATYEYGCTLGSISACGAVALMQTIGQGGPVDREAAQRSGARRLELCEAIPQAEKVREGCPAQ